MLLDRAAAAAFLAEHEHLLSDAGGKAAKKKEPLIWTPSPGLCLGVFTSQQQIRAASAIDSDTVVATNLEGVSVISGSTAARAFRWPAF